MRRAGLTFGSLMLLGVMLPTAAHAADPVMRDLTLTAPRGTELIVLAEYQWSALSTCAPGTAFDRCMERKIDIWGSPPHKIGREMAYTFSYNSHGKTRVYYTCNQRFSRDEFLNLGRNFSHGISLSVTCSTQPVAV